MKSYSNTIVIPIFERPKVNSGFEIAFSNFEVYNEILLVTVLKSLLSTVKGRKARAGDPHLSNWINFTPRSTENFEFVMYSIFLLVLLSPAT